ncbi:MAG TPA: CsgG/HfaB family protein [Verrucomicrobiae bacterium]|nr:CsgG/HfaB family protein [Verrucomicrobiae bacterium]
MTYPCETNLTMTRQRAPAWRRSLGALFCFLLLTWVFCAQATAPDVLTVAVFDFESRDEGMRDVGSKVSALINASLSAEPQIITVERAEFEKLLGEHELGLSGSVSADTAAKVGHLTGAQVLVTGRAFRADKELVIVAKIIGSETGRVYGELVKGGLGASVSDLSTELAKKIATTLSQKSETLVAKVENREQRIARLKQSLHGDRLPSLSLKISERHFGQPVIDPAAETELGLVLQKCGFKILSDKSSERPEIEITGEAFSAYALRKGNLISCKARVEVKASNRKGEVLIMDRQTSVAVDVAEQTAAKTALQNAALDVAERLVPALLK